MGRALKQKPYLVRWVIVCLDKRIGGLGIKCLFTINKALLDKWCRRFSNEKGAFWNQVISRKCGEEREWWFSGSEGGVWGWVMESDKEGLSSTNFLSWWVMGRG